MRFKYFDKNLKVIVHSLGRISFMINAKFKLNGEHMSKFEVLGNQFDAFSGMSNYRNKAKHMCSVSIGPIPIGAYYIVDRESGDDLEN